MASPISGGMKDSNPSYKSDPAKERSAKVRHRTRNEAQTPPSNRDTLKFQSRSQRNVQDTTVPAGASTATAGHGLDSTEISPEVSRAEREDEVKLKIEQIFKKHEGDQTTRLNKIGEAQLRQLREGNSEVLQKFRDIRAEFESEDKMMDQYLEYFHDPSNATLLSTDEVIKNIVRHYNLVTPAASKIREIEELYFERTTALLQHEYDARKRIVKKRNEAENAITKRLQKARKKAVDYENKWQHYLRGMEQRIKNYITSTKYDIHKIEKEHLIDDIKTEANEGIRQAFNIMRTAVRNSLLPLNEISYRLSWTKSPLFLKIQPKLCRSITDKLAIGRYVIRYSLRKQMGENKLNLDRRRKLVESVRAKYGFIQDSAMPFPEGVSAPALHVSPSEAILRFDGSTLLLLPPNTWMTPFMVLQLELCYLQPDEYPFDTVVAWTAFPLLDSNLHVIHGNFKAPLIKGRINKSLHNFIEIEKCIQSNLDAWLCNLYFSSALIIHEPQDPNTFKVNLGCEAMPKSRKSSSNNENLVHGEENTAFLSGESCAPPIAVFEAEYSSTQNIQIKPPNICTDETVTLPVTEVQKSFKNTEELLPASAILRGSTTPESGHLLTIGSQLLAPNAEHQLLGEYHYSVRSNGEELPSFLRYVGAVFRNGFEWRGKFLLMALLFTGMLLLSILLYSFGIWMAYVFLGDTIYSIHFSLLGVKFVANQRRELFSELLVTSLGPLFPTVMFAILVALQRLLIAKAAPSPLYVSYAIFHFGFLCILNPWIMALLDAIRYEDILSWDFMRLRNVLEESNESGAAGVVLTVTIYFILSTISYSLFLYFIINVHGRRHLLDAYRRLNGLDSIFLIPIDSLVTEESVYDACESARKFLGANGETKRIKITNIVESPSGKVDLLDLRQMMIGNKILHGGKSENITSSTELDGVFRDGRSTNTAGNVQLSGCSYITILLIIPDSHLQQLHRQFYRDENGHFYSVQPKNVFASLLDDYKSVASCEVFHLQNWLVRSSAVNRGAIGDKITPQISQRAPVEPVHFLNQEVSVAAGLDSEETENPMYIEEALASGGDET